MAKEYYRFLNETSYNWGRFLLLFAVKVTTAFDKLTRPERVQGLILDDSVIKRNRSKSVELLARVFDHVEHKCQKTYGELFFMFCDDIQDMDLTNALQSLMALFEEHISSLSADITSIIKCKVNEWIECLVGKREILNLTEEHICGNAPNVDENFKEQIRDIIVERLP